MTTSLHHHLLLKLSQGKTLREKGFTLIELLVVIVIIGILSAIALPSFLSQRGKAYDAEGKSIAGAIYRGFQACEAEKDATTCNQNYLKSTYGIKVDGYANHTVTVNTTAKAVNVAPSSTANDAGAKYWLATSNGICEVASGTATACSTTNSSSSSSSSGV